MAKLLLAISGRVEEGEALSASVFNTATGTSALTGFTLQWQVFNGSTWTNVGAANSLTYTIPSGNSAIGKSYRLVSTPTGANEASTSAATAPVVADTKSVHAPTLADVATSLTLAENAAPTLLDSAVTFNDADNGNFGGGSLTILNSNSLAAGGDGLDLLSVRNQGTGAGQISYNAATREVFYSAQAGNTVLIGMVDATLGGNGGDLKVAFNASATKVAIDKLIENIQFSNNDDSPTGARLLTIKVADPSAGSVQRVIQVNIATSADGPSFNGPSTFSVNENQLVAAAIAAVDPDREAAAVQGISYSLVAGTGSADNALFTINAATGQLSFLSAPDFEGAHAPAYSVRVRASDSNGGVTERVIEVQVQGVNEAPVAQPLTATIQEDAVTTSLAAGFSDPDAGDSHTITLDTAATLGTVTREGSNFHYEAGSQFQSLGQGQTATDTFSYTVTDAGGLSSTRTATLTIVGSNDAAVIAGVASGSVQEDVAVAGGQLSTQGTLSVTDVDAGQAAFVVQSSTAATYGSFDVDAAGHWTYRVANNLAAAQSLAAGASISDSFTVASVDGTASQVVTVMILGNNDAAVIGGATSGSVQEDVGLSGGSLSTGGTLTVADVDAGQSAFTAQANVAGSAGLGTFSLSAGGAWTYQVANNSSTVQGLVTGAVLTDSFTATSVDGTANQLVSVTIQGSNDAAVVGGTITADVYEDTNVVNGLLMASGVLSIADADMGQTHFVAQTSVAGDLFGGLFSIDASGSWTWQLVNDSPLGQVVPGGASYADGFTVTTVDGTTQVVSVNVHGANDSATIAGTNSVSLQEDVGVVNGLLKATGVATVVDPDFYEARLVSQLGVAGSAGYGTFNVFEQGTWNYRVDNGLAQVQALGEGQTLTDTLLVTSNDGSASTMLTATIMGINDGPAVTTSNGANLGEVTETGFVNSGVTQASGTLQATDPDAADTLTWSGNATGIYGHLEIAAATGQWTYTLDDDASATQALANGQTVTETFIATVSDSHGGTAQQQIVVSVQGANDAPVIDAWNTEGTVAESASGHLVLHLNYESGYKAATSADGRVILLTQTFDPDLGFARPALRALNADGTIDTAFGSDGSAWLSPYDQVNDISVDAAGGILLAGHAAGTGGVGTNPDFMVARFNADGTPDTSFGAAGRVTVEIAGSYDYADKVLTDGAGNIILTGRAITVPGSGNFDLTVVRLTSDGRVDAGFGTNGRWAFTLPDDPTSDYQVAFDNDSHMLVWGLEANAQTSVNEFHVYRYSLDGSLDAGFGNGGKAVVALSGTDIPQHSQLVAGGSGALALGWSQDDPTAGRTAVVVASLANGAVTRTFDTGFEATGRFDLAFDAQGHLLVAASTRDGWEYDALVARYSPSGNLDPTFGVGGVAVTAFDGGASTAEQLMVNADGGIVLGGYVYDYFFGGSPAFVKFDANGSPDPEFGREQAGRPIQGWLGGHDPEANAVLTWSGSADGVYGHFTMDDLGMWTYTLDNGRAATEALDEGETATDTFMVSLTDEYGAVVTQDVTITIVGSYDPTAP